MTLKAKEGNSWFGRLLRFDEASPDVGFHFWNRAAKKLYLGLEVDLYLFSFISVESIFTIHFVAIVKNKECR